jgi:hypothetical protein
MIQLISLFLPANSVAAGANYRVTTTTQKNEGNSTEM